MAGRSQFYESIGYRDTLADNAYRVILTGRVTVYVAPPFAATSMTTLAGIYSAATGVGSPGNPFDATSGEASFFVGPGAYDVKIEDMAATPRFAARTIRFESQPGDQGIVAQMIAAGTIDESKLALTPGQFWMPGDVKQTTRSAAPPGWIKAIGVTLGRSAYAALWEVAEAEIAAGNQIYGAGDGTTTFTIADLSRRVLVGAGSAGGLSARALGASGGEEAQVLTLAQSPAHDHPHTDNGHSHAASQSAHSHAASQSAHSHVFIDDNSNYAAIKHLGGGNPANRNVATGAGYNGGDLRTNAVAPSVSIGSTQPSVSVSSSTAGLNIGSRGGGQSHNNMQPFVIVHTLIKT